jgi:hypothetical protein
MIRGARRTASNQNFPKRSRKLRRRWSKQHLGRADLMAICKKFLAKNESFPILMPYFAKLRLSG